MRSEGLRHSALGAATLLPSPSNDKDGNDSDDWHYRRWHDGQWHRSRRRTIRIQSCTTRSGSELSRSRDFYYLEKSGTRSRKRQDCSGRQIVDTIANHARDGTIRPG